MNQRQSVEDQLAETGVILGQIINFRLLARLGWAGIFGFAVEIVRAIDLEVEVEMVIAGIDPLLSVDQPQGVSRKVAVAIQR